MAELAGELQPVFGPARIEAQSDDAPLNPAPADADGIRPMRRPDYTELLHGMFRIIPRKGEGAHPAIRTADNGGEPVNFLTVEQGF